MRGLGATRIPIAAGGVYVDTRALVLQPEPAGFQQNPERTTVAGHLLPRPPACQKVFWGKLGFFASVQNLSEMRLLRCSWRFEAIPRFA